MLINQLNIQRFRGISGVLEIDLSAPLTVIYAPNGTGKTSICDAVEWLLCGSIGRLSTLGGEDVKCRFGDSLETFVEVTIPHLSEPFALKRVLTSSSSQLLRKVGSGDFKQVDDQELLRLIVSAIPPSGNSTKAKVAWVRSTRFLESDSLNLLIDSDRESNDTRKLIFSNLFGVSEYQKAESDLNKILNKLPAASTIAREKNKLNAKIKEYEESIKKLIKEQSAPYRDHAHNLLNIIAERLNQNSNASNNIDIHEYHKLLEVKYIKATQNLSEQKKSLTYIQENILSYRDNVTQSEILEKKIKADSITFIALNNSHEKKQKELTEKQKNTSHREELIHELSEIINMLRSEKLAWNRFYDQYKIPHIEIDRNEARVSKLLDCIASEEKKIALLKQSVSEVNKNMQIIPALFKKREQLNGVNIELEALKARKPKQDHQVPLIEQISKIKAELDALQASREKTLGELELLISLGKSYVDAHEDNSECPLCEYKYDNNHDLLKRIDSRFSKLSKKSQQEAILASKHEELTQQLALENNHLKKFEELIYQKNQFETNIQELDASFTAIGIPKASLTQMVTLSDHLGKIRDQHLASIQEASQSIIPYRSAYDSAKELDDMLIKTKSLLSSWQKRLELPDIKLDSIDNLGGALSALEALLEKHVALLKQIHEDEKPVILKLSNDLSKIEEERNKKSADITVYKKGLVSLVNLTQDFKRKWEFISSSKNMSDSDIEKVAKSIADKEHLLNEIKEIFTKAEEYFLRILESQKKESECGVYKNELIEVQAQLQEWSNQEKTRTVIENEINLIKSEIRRFIAQEIKPLSGIINTLYLRAQGNRFINSIEARPSKDGFLEWIAELNENGESFDKMRSLSQGQRQDLALAIFLARARSLGGTFFLDEPLAHLDDLNRVALLDTLRIIVSEKRTSNPLRLVLTTASNNLLRHLREKFSLVESSEGIPALCIYKMGGNPKIGLKVESPELVHSPNRLLDSRPFNLGNAL